MERSTSGSLREDDVSLDLQSIEWWEYKIPFRHLRAQSVLQPEPYQRVCAAFQSILQTTDGGDVGPYRLKRTNPKYDARMLGMTEDLSPSFDPFFSSAWLQMIAGLVGLPLLRRIDGGLHSSPVASKDGWIHTDLCSGWFDESSAELGIFPDRRKCDYFTGKPKTRDANPVEYVRAATMIYYLCNEGWQEGDGGETGLYGSSRMGSQTPVSFVPPIDNSALVFECSPHSYHRFIANPGRARNSIILWLHVTVERATSIWGSAINRRKIS